MNRRKKEEDFYKSLIDKDDSLNKQLMLSEERGENRKKANGSRLMDEFAETMALKKQMKQEEDARNSKILATMSKMLQDEELQDIQKREKQVF